MNLRKICITCAALAVVALGCEREATTTPAPPEALSPQVTGVAAEAEDPVVETMEHYREKAAAEIDEENAEAELEKLKKEIDSELGE